MQVTNLLPAHILNSFLCPTTYKELKKWFQDNHVGLGKYTIRLTSDRGDKKDYRNLSGTGAITASVSLRPGRKCTLSKTMSMDKSWYKIKRDLYFGSYRVEYVYWEDGASGYKILHNDF